MNLRPTEAICICGCLSKDKSSKFVYSVPNTGIISRHLKANHPQLLAQFKECKALRGNWNSLEEQVAKLNDETENKLKRSRRYSEKFFGKLTDGFEHEKRAGLLLLMWAVSNGVSRNVLNCSLFDAYHKALGVQPPANRHTLQDQYLPLLDTLVVDNMVERLSKVPCVSLSADGWRDRIRRDWIDVAIYWIENISEGNAWKIAVLHPDLIPVPSTSTSEDIQTLVVETVDTYVRLFFR